MMKCDPLIPLYIRNMKNTLIFCNRAALDTRFVNKPNYTTASGSYCTALAITIERQADSDNMQPFMSHVNDLWKKKPCSL